MQSMSIEKIPYVLPAVLTIGPKTDRDGKTDHESLVKYAKLLEDSSTHKGHNTLDDIILGVIEGEARTISSQMTMEQIFNDRMAIKENILGKIQGELEQFGLKIYNANIKDLDDSPPSKYFHNMRQKKLSEVENEAKVHVAEATKKGDIGKKEREATTRQQIAHLEAETILRENERTQDVEKSRAALAVVQAEANRLRDIANIEAKKAADMRDTDLQRELEQKRIMMETEKMRAVDSVRAQVQAEARVKDAEGFAQAIKLDADAKLYAKRAEAEGLQAVLEAQAKGLNRVMASFGNDADAFARYMMIDRDMYVKMATENGKAVANMQPKFVSWTTSGAGASNPITDILKMIPPIATTIHDQVGIKIAPNWLFEKDSKADAIKP